MKLATSADRMRADSRAVWSPVPGVLSGRWGKVELDRWQDGVGEEKEGKGHVASYFLTWTSVFSK